MNKCDQKTKKIQQQKSNKKKKMFTKKCFKKLEVKIINFTKKSIRNNKAYSLASYLMFVILAGNIFV